MVLLSGVPWPPAEAAVHHPDLRHRSSDQHKHVLSAETDVVLNE